MIRKLRIKLIFASMLSLFLVLLVIMGVVNVLNYRGIVENADSTLAVLARNGGGFPDMEEASPFSGPAPDGEIPAGGPVQGDRSQDFLREMSPELPYESRYFSVLFDETGSVTAVDTGRIAAVGEEAAVTYAVQALDTGRERGFLADYRFAVGDEAGGTRVIFLDCGRSLDTFRSFLTQSILISVIGLVLVFLLVTLLSRRIVRPISESYEKQRQFITDAGHEIKTPIAIINADAEVLEMDLGDGNEWLQDIQTQTGRLASLTNDLIFLSRMEEGGGELTMLDFPFSDVVAECAQSFQAPALTQGKTYTADIQPSITLHGDEKSLRQLTNILLDNALKYSPAGGSVAVSLKAAGKNAVLQVSNTSEAVDPESLRHLFDRFYRTDKSRNSQTGGHGIGLSIARAVVDAHRGKISAAWRDGQMVMTAVLPL